MLPDLQTGGGQVIVLNNIMHMDQRCFQNFVCSIRREGDLESAFIEAGFVPFYLDHRPGYGVLTLLRLIRFIQHEAIDLIHTNDTRLDQFYGQLAGLLLQVPVVNTLHMPRLVAPPPPVVERSAFGPGLSGSLAFIVRALRTRLRVRSRLRGAVERRWWDWIARQTVKHLIADSIEVKRSWLGHRFPAHCPEKITVIYPGIAVEDFMERINPAHLWSLAKELALDGAYPILINVGRLVNQKGQAYLIPMMLEVLQQFPQARLLIVGEGPERSALERAITRAGLGRAITLLGTRHDIPALLAIGDIFVFPSVAEGFGLAMLEALAAGKPAVAFRIPPLTEFVQDGITGHLVEPFDVKALAAAVASIASDRQRARDMGERARRTAAECFAISRQVRLLEGVYRSVIEETRQTHRAERAIHKARA
jgi:glycosyltransferase involved in cell wall biosynthesis